MDYRTGVQGFGESARHHCGSHSPVEDEAIDPDRDDFTVAHYIFSNPSTSLWRAYFLNPIENLFAKVGHGRQASGGSQEAA